MTLLATQPELINQDPYGEGWILRLQAGGERVRRGSAVDATAYAGRSGRGRRLTMPYIPHTRRRRPRDARPHRRQDIDDLFDEIPPALRVDSLARRAR